MMNKYSGASTVNKLEIRRNDIAQKLTVPQLAKIGVVGDQISLLATIEMLVQALLPTSESFHQHTSSPT